MEWLGDMIEIKNNSFEDFTTNSLRERLLNMMKGFEDYKLIEKSDKVSS